MMRVKIVDLAGTVMVWKVEQMLVGHDSQNAILLDATMESVGGKPTNSTRPLKRVVIPLVRVSSITEERW